MNVNRPRRLTEATTMLWSYIGRFVDPWCTSHRRRVPKRSAPWYVVDSVLFPPDCQLYIMCHSRLYCNMYIDQRKPMVCSKPYLVLSVVVDCIPAVDTRYFAIHAPYSSFLSSPLACFGIPWREQRLINQVSKKKRLFTAIRFLHDDCITSLPLQSR